MSDGDKLGAARLDDEITHGLGMVGMVAGAVLGLIVGAAIVGASVATGGLADIAFVAIVGGSIAGGGLSGGSLIKGIMKHFDIPGPVSGMLAQGVPNIRINGRPVMCAGVDYALECSGAPMTHFKRQRVLIAEGSRTVRVNGFPMARLGSKLTCGATIKTASPNVFVGGPTVLAVKPEDMDDNEAAFEDILAKLGIVSLFCAGVVAGAAGVEALLLFGAFVGGTQYILKAAHKWGDSLGPGYGDIIEGVAGFALLGLGAKGADSEAGEAAMEGRLKIEADPNKIGMNGGNFKSTIIPREEPINGNLPELTPTEESKAALDRANAAKENLANTREYKAKTTASDDKVTISGWKQPRPDGFDGATAEQVKDMSEKIGHDLKPHPYDKDFEGQYNASHAEKQLSIISPDDPAGVSKPMCSDCQVYYQKLAQYRNTEQVVTDPNGTWTYKPDGTVIKPDGTFIPPK